MPHPGNPKQLLNEADTCLQCPLSRRPPQPCPSPKSQVQQGRQEDQPQPGRQDHYINAQKWRFWGGCSREKGVGDFNEEMIKKVILFMNKRFSCGPSSSSLFLCATLNHILDVHNWLIAEFGLYGNQNWESFHLHLRVGSLHLSHYRAIIYRHSCPGH